MSETIVKERPADATAFPILGAISAGHFLNDLTQSLLPAVYPILRGGFHLSFAQLGLLTFIYQITASLLQPLVGLYTDKRPQPYALPFSMTSSLLGLLALAYASSYGNLVLGAFLLGIGSSIFHPESSRIARLASGGAHGLAQSLFQVGGNFGSALGPLLVAYLILPGGLHDLAWFSIALVAGLVLMTALSHWYKTHGHARPSAEIAGLHPTLPRKQVIRAVAVLIVLIISKFVYTASIVSYYAFYMIQRFGLSTHDAQICQFIFLAAIATGTVAGGPIGDRVGRKTVIWVSILGVLPFTLALPYVGLTATILLSAVIGVVLASAFPAIVVYAQELIPGRTGMISGLFFGLAFGVAGIGAALLGGLADRMGIAFVYHLCAFLPLLGLFAVFLPNLRTGPSVNAH
jgi:FSR family fosmidomycin resistance protein-like MFS transporter